MNSSKENLEVNRGGNLAEKFEITQQTPAAGLRIVSAKPSDDPLDEIKMGKTVRRHVRDFACILALASLFVAAYLIFEQSSLANVGAAFVLALVLVLAGYVTPRLLRPIWEAWMKLGELLGFVVTTVLLFIVWVVLFIPMGIGLHLFKKAVMDTTFRTNAVTYWIDRDPSLSNFKLLERQY